MELKGGLYITPRQLLACGANPAYIDRYIHWIEFFKNDRRFEINTALRLSHFLAQLIHESMNFSRVLETGSGERYEGNKKLGNTEPGDGKKYKGRGLIQITGRWNYGACQRFFGEPYLERPELMERDKDAVAVSFWYWRFRKLNAWADKDNLQKVTSGINAGMDKIDRREKLLTKSKSALTDISQYRNIFPPDVA
ncbi:glycoside hydrolase family 19 protein [Spirosoma endbachense]|uniref:Glycoside hydrolase family 19 catalytic domain-containing protein n=1 Tax=Spirosoma endbachense TaxID=2666025 RepID=A0A6P1VQN1_9BACT|nr:glycoside hydrolase family 19 protein [Spirosoma endbachense]QHV94017.1 hypothetical protein GJR95_02790 [Spirosoma endbachense]